MRSETPWDEPTTTGPSDVTVGEDEARTHAPSPLTPTESVPAIVGRAPSGGSVAPSDGANLSARGVPALSDLRVRVYEHGGVQVARWYDPARAWSIVRATRDSVVVERMELSTDVELGHLQTLQEIAVAVHHRMAAGEDVSDIDSARGERS